MGNGSPVAALADVALAVCGLDYTVLGFHTPSPMPDMAMGFTTLSVNSSGLLLAW